MRRPEPIRGCKIRRALCLVFALGVALAGPGAARAAGADTAPPLAAPTDLPPEPEQIAAPPAERALQAAAVLRARGYGELPVLARALLQTARERQSPELVDRALDLAPGSAALAFEAGWQFTRPLQLLRAAVLVPQSFPGQLWSLTWGGAALGVASLLAASTLALLSLGRALTLHGHALGHLLLSRDPPAWPGCLLLLALLAGLLLTGIGVAAVAAAVGLLAIMRLPRREAGCLVVALALYGVLLGPPLEYWARLASLPARHAPLLAAWRLEHGQALRGDREEVERGVAREPGDPVLRLALATDRKRAGELDRVQELVADFPVTSPGLAARAANLDGILQLGRGDLREAIRGFERARANEESAAILYNLSQAHGRALHLSEQENLFGAARRLDADLVSRHTTREGEDLHAYLMESLMPPTEYVRSALAPSPEAGRLARGVRQRLLGAELPDLAWLGLPVLAVLGLLLHRPGLTRCARCVRTICARCAPEEVSGGTCVRCARLFVPTPTTDARLRQRQIRRDRARQRWLGRGVALIDSILPGGGHALEGRLLGATVRLMLLALGVGALGAARWVPVPAEVGGVGAMLPLALAGAIALPLYAHAWLSAVRRLRGGGTM